MPLYFFPNIKNIDHFVSILFYFYIFQYYIWLQMMKFEWYCHGFRRCFFRFSQVSLFAILTPCFWNEFEYVVKKQDNNISSINTITQCWEHKVDHITLIWSLLSCNSSLIWSVFIIPLLLRYPIVHVEPPTVTVYLRMIGFGFWTSITVSRQTNYSFA